MTTTSILEKLKQAFGEAVLETEEARDMPIAVCDKLRILEILQFLRDDPELDFTMLTDLTVVDYLKHPLKQRNRFAVVYFLYSLEQKHRLRLKVPLGMEDLTIGSATPLWKTANWLEREAFDMFGIRFLNHPNLKRILTHHEFIGHALRKDYPVKKRQILTINDPLSDEMEKRLREKGLKL